MIFIHITYLFRPITYNRYHIVGLEKENVDMVYIGGSAAFVYWQPLKAWNDCGYTSYNYATDTVQAENIKAYLQETQKSQKSDLYVIDVRAFQYYSDEEVESGLRNGTDSMDLTNPVRYKLLREYFSNRNISTNKLSYYLDIVKYHNNISNLANKAAWQLINNNGTSINKGWEWIDDYEYLEEPKDYCVSERAELLDNDKKILYDLLDYCKSEKLNVLFVVCPYWITKEDYAKYNTIHDIVKEYDYDYINANDYYEEMNLDFESDFYNKNHVNMFGASKYTEFLEKYIAENYSLKDHRGESEYISWDNDFLRFEQEEEVHAKKITNVRLNKEKTFLIQENIKNTTEIKEWEQLVNDTRFSLVLVQNGKINWPKYSDEETIFETIGADRGDTKIVKIIKGEQIISSKTINESEDINGVLGIWNDINYNISLMDNIVKITIDKKDIFTYPNNLEIVVFENNYRNIVEVVELYVNDEGKTEIKHCE